MVKPHGLDSVEIASYESNSYSARLSGPVTSSQPSYIRKKNPDKRGQLILLRDDARSLIANVVKVALLNLNCKVLLHSPNLTLTDFHLFRFLGIIAVALPSTRIKNSKRDWKNFLATFWQNRIRHIVGRLEKIGNCYGGLLLE